VYHKLLLLLGEGIEAQNISFLGKENMPRSVHELREETELLDAINRQALPVSDAGSGSLVASSYSLAENGSAIRKCC
jgi:hypothetical protein